MTNKSTFLTSGQTNWLFYLKLLLSCFCSHAVTAQVTLLDPASQQKFIHPLPNPSVIDATAGGTFNMYITQFNQDLGLRTSTNTPMMTTVWGYNGTYPGPTVVARKNIATNFFWYNNLKDGSNNPLPHLLPIDTSVNWALEDYANWQDLGVPIVTHLHGGHSESASDGLPEAWYTPGFAQKGEDFVKGDISPFHYDNDQESATLWYHDHAMGITRLNVYAGLAGFYLLRDSREDSLIAANKIPSGPYERGIVIQDRMFTSSGQLYYPSESEVEDAPEPSIQPEFFGDFILVNGKTWPVLEVEPRQYRFRFLNGSDSRFYNLYFTQNLKFNQIGTDDGFLEAPVPLNEMLMGPGERADVVIDFSDPKLWGKTLILRNNARSPFPNGESVDMKTTGQIMAFRVNVPLNTSYPMTSFPSSLRPAIQPLVQTGPTRQLILFEGTDGYGRLQTHLGTATDGAMLFDDAITENPVLDDVEQWEIFNLTADAHPIHLHLVSFQLQNRQKFKADQDATTAAISNIKLLGPAKSPSAREKGWKDTEVMLPGEVTRLKAKFDREGLYVWHCHILSHEDHEMMRPYYVGTLPLAKKTTGIAKSSALNNGMTLDQNYPNPFEGNTTIYFHLPEASNLSLKMYNALGQEVITLAKGFYSKGTHSATLEKGAFAPGLYSYSLASGNHTITRKLLLK